MTTWPSRSRVRSEWVADNRNKVDIEDDPELKAAEPRPKEIGKLLSSVEPEEVEWLWPSWLAFGKLALMDGDPGLGKSATTLDIAARVSAGRDFPDGTGEAREPAGVVLLSAEDGLADTIRPRLDAAGGEASRIVALATVPDENGHERLLSIPEDLPLIEKGIERVGARLVVVDPLMAFLSGQSQQSQRPGRQTRPGAARGTGREVRGLRVGSPAPQQSTGQQPSVSGWRVHRHHRGGALRAAGRATPRSRVPAGAGAA